MIDARTAADLTDVVKSIITPHDEFQDAVMLFLGLVGVANLVLTAIHLLDHKRWREEEGAEHRGCDRS